MRWNGKNGHKRRINSQIKTSNGHLSVCFTLKKWYSLCWRESRGSFAEFSSTAKSISTGHLDSPKQSPSTQIFFRKDKRFGIKKEIGVKFANKISKGLFNCKPSNQKKFHFKGVLNGIISGITLSHLLSLGHFQNNLDIAFGVRREKV